VNPAEALALIFCPKEAGVDPVAGDGSSEDLPFPPIGKGHGQPRRSILENAPFLFRSASFAQVIEEAVRAAAAATLVLLSGESGTGKGRVARLMHAKSGRPGPFVAWSAPETQGQLLLSAIFGHRKGAFTDAKKDSQGLFQIATGGTLFADEIDKLEIGGQPALLKFMDDRMVRPVGDPRSTEVDVFFIAATNRDLDSLAQRGQFLADLANRLSGIRIRIPPLRERVEDIPLLVEYFAREYGLLYAGAPAVVTSGAMEILIRQPWPSNVRGLVKVVENAVFRSRDGRVDEPQILKELGSTFASTISPEEELCRLAELPMDTRVRLEVVRRAIDLAGGIGKKAAASLGIPLRTFRRLTGFHKIRWRAQ
jgi:DNA-binding NtrC family response regulator